MAVEGFVDAWGGSPCTGPGDGWAFYYYYPRSKGYEAVYACNGYIGPGPSQYIPVDMNQHEPITGKFVDSDLVIDKVLARYGSVMDETLGRRFAKHATLLLLNYRVSPYGDPERWEIRLLWQLTTGRTHFRLDAKKGKLIDVVK